MYTDYKIYLASGSPRRRELLKLLGVDFSQAAPIDIEESYPSDLKAEDVPVFLADLKAKAYEKIIGQNELYITADTVVILDGKVLGKPHGREEAIEMLEMLSGATHKVVTGVCLFTKERKVLFSTTTEVEFAPLRRDDIESYVDECRPFDKAGAYGIQERIGAIGVKEIRGSFYNVMGLPVHRLYEALRGF